MSGRKILLVDDEVKACEMVGRYLKTKGYKLSMANDGEAALAKCRSENPDVVVMDIRMPVMDGIKAMQIIKKEMPLIEVIMASAVVEIEIAISCMKDGAFSYQVKPINLESLTFDIEKALEHRRLIEENKDYQHKLEEMVQVRTAKVKELNVKLRKSFLESIKILIGIVEIYDHFLGSHSKRMSRWAVKVGQKMGLNAKQLSDIELAALLHDVGKVGLPDTVRISDLKSLSKEEIDLLHNHPIYAQSILSPSDELIGAGKIIRNHLERFDGTGFPDQLGGDEIPIESRILSVVNAYDELVHRRRFTDEKLYSDESKREFALKMLYKDMGKKFQADIVAVLEKVIDESTSGKIKKHTVKIDQLTAGMRLGNSIFSPEGRLLIAKGNVFNSVQISKLKKIYQLKILKQDILVYES